MKIFAIAALVALSGAVKVQKKMAHQLHAHEQTDSLARNHCYAKITAKASDKDLMDAMMKEVKTENGMTLEELMAIGKENAQKYGYPVTDKLKG